MHLRASLPYSIFPPSPDHPLSPALAAPLDHPPASYNSLKHQRSKTKAVVTLSVLHTTAGTWFHDRERVRRQHAFANPSRTSADLGRTYRFEFLAA